MSEAEVCLLMQMARWRAIDDADPSLALVYGMGLPWHQVLKYLGEVYRERAHLLITPQCRHLFLMSAASPDRHRTHHGPVCRRLQRLVADGTAQATEEPTGAPHEAGEDEQSYSA